MEGCSPQDEDVIAYFNECKDYQPPFQEMRDGVRIACFGSQRDNLLMWSHYADGLRGFCIVFDENLVVSATPIPCCRRRSDWAILREHERGRQWFGARRQSGRPFGRLDGWWGFPA
ncbi:DUF2971 domain-containing protein [Histidinibacterium lentulum]|uniref:DUF2971 domain-containing protein n=1 Tax=Histidinibacterium lentulum TaxID=2480588 RepID=A0A3N2QHC1_9RHOB|nr:DUF2971 domain-containing protein [Histidinibacterium lentulum]